MKDQQIVVSGSLPRPEIELAPSAFNAREVALASAAHVVEIHGVAELDEAALALTTLKGIIRTVEDSRKEVKAPVLEVGKRIDSVAKEYLEPLEAEAKRLSILVGSYQEAQRLKAERLRQEESRKQQAALEEMQRKQREAMEAGDAESADAARAEAADKIAESQIAVMKAEGPKLSNVSTRGAWKFELVDIDALLGARPDLCVIEPNGAAIRAILKATDGKAIPGLRIWREATAVVRAATSVNPDNYDY